MTTDHATSYEPHSLEEWSEPQRANDVRGRRPRKALAGLDDLYTQPGPKTAKQSPSTQIHLDSEEPPPNTPLKIRFELPRSQIHFRFKK